MAAPRLKLPRAKPPPGSPPARFARLGRGLSFLERALRIVPGTSRASRGLASSTGADRTEAFVELPDEAELRSFARAAAQLLIDRAPRLGGSKAVARHAGAGIQHLDHRDYIPGDEIRHIDWRQTARFGRALVHRFEAETISDWTILIDASSSMTANGAVKWRCAVQAAAAMSHALIEFGHRVGLLAFGSRVLARCPLGRGQHHYAVIARLLAGLRPMSSGERSALGACALHLSGTASALAISDFLADDEMCFELAVLRARCATLHALQVSDVTEVRLPPFGEIELSDLETGTRLQVLADDRTATSAADQRAAMTARLRTFCSRSGIAFSDWEVARPWREALIAHLVRARSNG
jgi:uncharacterized protein (DUF58 family)